MRIGKWVAVLLVLQLTLGVTVFVQRVGEGTLSFEKQRIVGREVMVRAPHKRSLTATAHVLIGAFLLVSSVAIRAHAHGPTGPTSDKMPA